MAKKPREGQTEVISAAQFLEEMTSPVLPPGWGLVNGKPFTASMGAALSGKPVELPLSWQLPEDMRGASGLTPKGKRRRLQQRITQKGEKKEGEQ